MIFKNAFLHFKKICIHKYWVFYYCCKAGIPIQGVTHDLSKFSPTEFFESIKYYQGTSSPIDACKKVNGYSMAWFHRIAMHPKTLYFMDRMFKFLARYGEKGLNKNIINKIYEDSMNYVQTV